MIKKVLAARGADGDGLSSRSIARWLDKYKAEQTLRLIADLGSEAEHCAAYSPWLKPFVERFFRTQNSQLEVCCQGISDITSVNNRRGVRKPHSRGGAANPSRS